MEVPNRISIVTFGVADVARSTAFYESLGWHRSSSSMDTITFFQMQGSIFGLYERGDLADDVGVSAVGTGFRGVTVALNVASNDEVDYIFAEWVEAGATPVKAPEEVFWGGYSSYVADPDGHFWELVHNPHATIGDDGALQIGEPAS